MSIVYRGEIGCPDSFINWTNCWRHILKRHKILKRLLWHYLRECPIGLRVYTLGFLNHRLAVANTALRLDRLLNMLQRRLSVWVQNHAMVII